MNRHTPKILIIKVGTTLPSLLAKRGDFEHWVLSGMGLKAARTSIVDVRNGSPLPSYDEISGVLIAGSHAMVTEHHAWSERTAAWLPGAVERGIPILGICYGHQLLAYALGGKVEDNPNGREFGTVEVHLNENASRDLLLGALPTPIKAHVSHVQSVLSLPHNAVRLASSTMDRNQAFVVGDVAWGVQFHPEFDAQIVAEYIQAYNKALRAEGQDPDHLAGTCVDTPFGSQILRRFVEIVVESASVMRGI